MIRSLARALFGSGLIFIVGARAQAQVDFEATRAYLRTGVNLGSEVTAPAPGQDVYLHVDYKVVGGTVRVKAFVRALIDGEEHCMGEINFDPDTDMVIWCPEPYKATAGTHTLRWMLDSERTVTESNEGNNAVQTMFTTAATGSRDLEALRAFLQTQANSGDEVVTPALGQQVYLHFEYRIGGTGADFMARVAAKLDGAPFCSGPITFTPGVDGVVWCPSAWTATAGSHTLEWEIDSAHVISETDETNNTTRVTFTTGTDSTEDIEAERAFLQTQVNAGQEITRPDIGQEVFFHIDYGVTGFTEAFTAGVRALIDDEEHCAGPVTFDPEPGTIWCDVPWVATEGTHTLRWTLDSEQVVDESNENNNSVATTFRVGGPDVCVGDCDDSNAVVVNELVTGVNIALDRADIEDCPAFDNDSSGTVAINELVSGVDNLLRGCR